MFLLSITNCCRIDSSEKTTLIYYSVIQASSCQALGFHSCSYLWFTNWMFSVLTQIPDDLTRNRYGTDICKILKQISMYLLIRTCSDHVAKLFMKWSSLGLVFGGCPLLSLSLNILTFWKYTIDMRTVLLPQPTFRLISRSENHLSSWTTTWYFLCRWKHNSLQEY